MTQATAYTGLYADQKLLFDATLCGSQLIGQQQHQVSAASLISSKDMALFGSADSNDSLIVATTLAVWIFDAVRSLNSLLALEENWDSYGARAISIDTALSTIRLLDSVIDDRTPMPSIVPVPTGSIQLEWHQSGIDLEVEVTDSGRFSISYEDMSGQTVSYEEESPMHSIRDPGPLVVCIKEIQHRIQEEPANTYEW